MEGAETDLMGFLFRSNNSSASFARNSGGIIINIISQ